MTDATQNQNPSNLPTDHPAHPANVPPVVPVVPTPSAPAAPVAPTEPAVAPDAPAGTYGGDTVLDTAISVFSGQTGVTADKFQDALAGALKHNDIELINFDALTQGLKPDQAAQAKALATAAFKETQGNIQRATQDAYTLAGGEQQWKEATAAFNTSAPAHLKAVVNTMLQSGDVKNAAQFVLETVRGSGMVNNGTPQVEGGASAPTQGLTQAEFRSQLADLERTAGNRSLEQGLHGQKFQQLVAARNLGRKQGR